MNDERKGVWHKAKFPHERYSDEWNRAAGQAAMAFAPSIKACRECGAPVVSGYCCTYAPCRSVNP